MATLTKQKPAEFLQTEIDALVADVGGASVEEVDLVITDNGDSHTLTATLKTAAAAPAAEPATEPAAEPATEPAIEPAVEPAAEPAAEQPSA